MKFWQRMRRHSAAPSDRLGGGDRTIGPVFWCEECGSPYVVRPGGPYEAFLATDTLLREYTHARLAFLRAGRALASGMRPSPAQKAYTELLAQQRLKERETGEEVNRRSERLRDIAAQLPDPPDEDDE